MQNSTDVILFNFKKPQGECHVPSNMTSERQPTRLRYGTDCISALSGLCQGRAGKRMSLRCTGGEGSQGECLPKLFEESGGFKFNETLVITSFTVKNSVRWDAEKCTPPKKDKLPHTFHHLWTYYNFLSTPVSLCLFSGFPLNR